jgi:hypothetical protein
VVRDRIPKAFGLNAIRDIQVLCPMNRGGLGARSLNIELQKALNAPGEERIERFGWTFGPGDNDDPQEPGLGISGSGDSLGDAALHDVGAQPALHGCDAREAAGGVGRSTESVSYRGSQPRLAPPLGQTARAPYRYSEPPIADYTANALSTYAGFSVMRCVLAG